jgi:hypothetical protein
VLNQRSKSAPEAGNAETGTGAPAIAAPPTSAMRREKAGFVAVQRGQCRPLQREVGQLPFASSCDYRHRRCARVKGTTAKNYTQRAIPHSQLPASIMKRKLILPTEVKVCATCSYWDGERKVDTEMQLVVVSESCVGECLVQSKASPSLTDGQRQRARIASGSTWRRTKSPRTRMKAAAPPEVAQARLPRRSRFRQRRCSDQGAGTRSTRRHWPGP